MGCESYDEETYLQGSEVTVFPFSWILKNDSIYTVLAVALLLQDGTSVYLYDSWANKAVQESTLPLPQINNTVNNSEVDNINILQS